MEAEVEVPLETDGNRVLVTEDNLLASGLHPTSFLQRVKVGMPGMSVDIYTLALFSIFINTQNSPFSRSGVCFIEYAEPLCCSDL